MPLRHRKLGNHVFLGYIDDVKRKSQPTAFRSAEFLKTGIHPDAIPVIAHPLTIDERIDQWFIRPLKRMSGHDAFVALVVCLPLIEKIVRFKADELRDEELTFSQGSKLITELATLLEISEPDAALFWQQFRVGMMHRAMVKPTVGYQLDPLWAGPAVKVMPPDCHSATPTFCINIWKLRDKVVRELSTIGTKIWKDPTCPLPTIYIELAK